MMNMNKYNVSHHMGKHNNYVKKKKKVYNLYFGRALPLRQH